MGLHIHAKELTIYRYHCMIRKNQSKRVVSIDADNHGKGVKVSEKGNLVGIDTPKAQ